MNKDGELYFLFEADHLNEESELDFIARIPAGLPNRASLFDALKHKLKLPEYFGNNWDALEECLKDLYWIPNYRICLVHEDIPSLEQNEVLHYFEILKVGILNWRNHTEHELVVIFPRKSKLAIENIFISKK